MQVSTRTGPRSAVVSVEVTVQVAGVADLPVISEVAATIRAMITAGVRHLVVDVSAARAVGPEMLTVLARADAELNGGLGSFRLVGVALPEFDAALKDAALDEVFVVYDALRPRTPAVPVPRART